MNDMTEAEMVSTAALIRRATDYPAYPLGKHNDPHGIQVSAMAELIANTTGGHYAEIRERIEALSTSTGPGSVHDASTELVAKHALRARLNEAYRAAEEAYRAAEAAGVSKAALDLIRHGWSRESDCQRQHFAAGQPHELECEPIHEIAHDDWSGRRVRIASCPPDVMPGHEQHDGTHGWCVQCWQVRTS